MLKKRFLSVLLVGSLAISSYSVSLAISNDNADGFRPSVIAYAASGLPVTIVQQSNGTATCSSDAASEGSTVTVKVSPSGGYSSGGIAVADAENNAISVKQVNAGEYSFTMPGSEVMVVPIFLAGSSGAETTTVSSAATADTTQSGAISDASKPVPVGSGEPEPVVAQSNSPVTNNTAAEDPATVDIANQSNSTVVIATDGNSVTGTSSSASAGVNMNTNQAVDIQASEAPVSESQVTDTQITNEQTISSQIVSGASENMKVVNDGLSGGADASDAIVVSSDSMNSDEAIESSGVVVPSESNSTSSGTIVVPSGGSGIVSNTIVVPSRNGIAEADTVPVSAVVVPSSSAPQMVFPESEVQETKQTTLVSSVSSEDKVTSTITGVTQIPNLLSVAATPALAMSVVGGKTIERNGVPAEKILSAYVPLELPVETADNGRVITPQNAKIISDVKMNNIRVESVNVKFDSGWGPIDGSDTSMNDSENQLSVSLRQDSTNSQGRMKLTENNWVVRPKKSLSLNMGAVLADDITIFESPVSIEFVLDWE